MSVKVSAVQKDSYADRAGVTSGDTLVSLNGNDIMDVLDYRFYQNNHTVRIEWINAHGKTKTSKIHKEEYAELGMEFETYLMDQKHSCRNKCIFCFIDQLPKGLRESLYFKDDDSRLSFLFGNYITLTNITEHEVERIIKMHISPINISVHTTNPELRVKMMNNKHAGEVLTLLDRFNAAGIKLNCQLVLCPGYNDGQELERTLRDLTALSNVECIAAVPVGLTRYREGLTPLKPFHQANAGAVLDMLDRYGEECLKRYGQRRVYGADEFYLLAKREIPKPDFYEEFLQLENGVGLWSLLKSEAETAVKENNGKLEKPRKISLATGEAAFPLIRYIADLCEAKWKNLTCRVYPVKNNFFGGRISVSGLVTATDILEQLRKVDLGKELLIPSSMLRAEGDLFLDSISLAEVSEKLSVKITPVDNDGYSLVDTILGTGTEN